MNETDHFERAAAVLHEAEAVYITAGAGIGVDSGLPDFRGNEGFWKAYPPIARLGISFVEMANPAWFEQDPKLAWAFYGHRLNLYRETVPHSGFQQLLELSQGKPGQYFVFTSNVDGQFQKAGYAEDRIEECHGSIHHLQCAASCGSGIWEAKETEVLVDEEQFRALGDLPSCPRCGGIARPNILMFGDWSWIGTRSQMQGSNMDTWLREIDHKGLALAIVELGAGKAVPTVRYQSERMARREKTTLIRINPRDYEVPDSRHISLPLGSKEGIARITGNFD
jgi:NAD-dependent SIR2 family protein deacetylase